MVHITEEHNELQITPPIMLCDNALGDIPAPLPSQAFFLICAGSAGSGKTSFLVSILSQKKPKIYRKVFENVFIIAPPHSLASIKSNIFRNHPEDKIYHELTPDNLNDIKSKVLKEASDGFNSLLIIDDMTVYLKDKQNEKLLKDLVMNRRHYHLSLIILVQTYTAISLPLRKTISHGVIWKPKNKKEMESIAEEILFQPKHVIEAVSKFVFKKPHDFLFFDASNGDLHHNFKKLNIDE